MPDNFSSQFDTPGKAKAAITEQAQAANTAVQHPDKAIAVQHKPSTAPTNVQNIYPKPTPELIDIAVRNMPARDFFLTLVDGSSRNLVVHPQVEGTVTLSLNQVTLEQVLQTVREVYGFEFRKTGSIIQVLPSRMATRIFAIDYLNVARSGNSQTRVSSGQLTESVASDSSSDSDSDDDNSDTQSRQSTGEISGSQVTTSSYADFWTMLEHTLSLIIGSEQGRQVVINPDVGVAVISAMPGELREVEKYLSTIQDIAQRQVILEAKIIEVELSNGFRSGINWAALLEFGSKSAVISQTGGASLLGNSDASAVLNNQALSNNASLNDDDNSSLAFGGALTAALNLGDFQAFIELLQMQGEVQVLSSPRISTINNQKAVIKVGTDEFFVTDVSTDTSNNNGGTNQSVEVELTPFFSGVALDVIPQIDADGTVVLHIHPTVSEVSEKVKNIDISTSSQLSVPLALSNIRESDTIVRARSGEVVVIGGLMSSLQQNIEAGTPGLSKLPWLGKLFKHQGRAQKRSELVILLRPMIPDQQRPFTPAQPKHNWNQRWNQGWDQNGDLISRSLSQEF